MTEQEEIREGLAKHIFLEQRTNEDYVYRRPSWEELGKSAKQVFFDKANQLLSRTPT